MVQLGGIFQPARRSFGNCGRNILRGPWRGNQDVSVIKYFQIAEGKNLEFRTEMFNARTTSFWDAQRELERRVGPGPNRELRHDYRNRGLHAPNPICA